MGLKKLLFSGVMTALVLLVMEGSSYAAIQVLYMKGYLSAPPRKHAHTLDYDRYRRIRHEVLGWPLKEGHDAFGGSFRDATGARRLPAFPDPDGAPTCLSLYGDSFVQGYRVDDRHTWANLLAQKLGCRVSNYGEESYGTDQALLRHRLNTQDKAPVVILGHMHEDIRRNLTRIRDFLGTARDYSFKPRFIVDSRGQLVLVPILSFSEAQYERALGLRSPRLRLEHENFQPGGPLVAPPEHLPFTLSLIRALNDYRVRARLARNRPSYAEFYQPGNVTHGLELMVGLAKAFRSEAERRGQRGVMLFLPPREVLSYYLRTNTWIHQPLLDRLKHEEIPYMDFGPYLIEHSDDVLNKPFFKDGHYNDWGEALLASMVAEELRQ